MYNEAHLDPLVKYAAAMKKRVEVHLITVSFQCARDERRREEIADVKNEKHDEIKYLQHARDNRREEEFHLREKAQLAEKINCV
jgi:hypothetical protein